MGWRDEKEAAKGDTKFTAAEIVASRIREKRQGFGTQTTFGEHKREGWRRRWVNDINIPFRKDQGWEFVSKSNKDTSAVGFEGVDVADRITKPNKATNPDGSHGMTTLMEIPEEIALEIIKAMVDDPTDKTEQALRVGNPGGAAGSHTYVPKDTPIRIG